MFFALYQQANVGIPYSPHARHRFFQVKGHLIVAQIGIMAYCLDGDNGKVLWRHPLVEGLDNQPNMFIQPAGADADGNPEFVIVNQNQFGAQQRRLTIGQIGAVQASYVALLTHKGLEVNDPLRGTLLWKKPDVVTGTRVFGDEEYLFLVEGGEGGGIGAGRVLRAIDGAMLDKIPDFGPVYQNRIAVQGRRILAAVPGKGQLTLRLYDIVTGKDIWSKKFDPSSIVLRTDDPSLTGVIDLKGNIVVLDAANGAEIQTGNVIHRKIGLDNVKGLQNPLLLADADRFYVVLSKPVDAGKFVGGGVHNNFSNGLRCYPVNGWVAALHRKDGSAKVNGETKPYKKGDFAWHSFAPLQHQMLILEQFAELPVLLFSARYNEPINNGMGGFTWRSYTQSINKTNGKFIYDEGPESNNSSPQYYAFNVDQRAGTINMIGYTSVVQHYIDDGRKLPAVTMNPANGAATDLANPFPNLFAPQPAFMPGVAMPVRINGNLRILPPVIAPVGAGGADSC